MERLTTREKYPHGAEGVSKDKLTGHWCRGTYEATAVTEKLAEYENAEEDKRLIKLACAIGDTVYLITRNFISTFEVTGVCVYSSDEILYKWTLKDGIYLNMNGFTERDIGKTVFLIKEKAEKELKTRKANMEDES